MKSVAITYFSDVLCIWANIAQLRLDAIRREHGDHVVIEHRFCNVFGDTARKIPAAWQDGYRGFNAHIRHVSAGFDEITINPDLWLTVRPASSASPHLCLKAVQLAERSGEAPAGSGDNLLRAMREAFFVQAHDIAVWGVQRDILQRTGVDPALVEARIRDGRAFAALASDYQDADALKIQGSPTFLFNEGRQKLYGNVGYRIIDANIRELLREPNSGQASWC